MSNRTVPITLALLALSGVLAACVAPLRANQAPSSPDAPVHSTRTLASASQDDMGVKAAEGANAFGFELFRDLHGRKPGENLFISPPSLSLALGMAYGGAAGQTATEMAKVLRYGDALGAETGNATLLRAMQSADDKITVSVANALWVGPKYTINPHFAARCVSGYGASVATLPQSDSEAAGLINGWVSRATNQMITQLVSPADMTDAAAVLTNAVYFKGAWTRPFSKKRTRSGRFTPERGASYEIPMMEQTAEFGYRGPEPVEAGTTPEGMQAVRMAYGKQGGWAMYAFLPKRGESLSDFVATLTPEKWRKWRGEFQNRPVSVVLPRFKSESGGSVAPSLKAMGMQTALSEAADFGGMFDTRQKFFLSGVIHKTALKVTEEATEAAAASAAIARTASAVVRRPTPRVVFDRPFVCAIVQEETGAVVFLGAFYQPTPNMD